MMEGRNFARDRISSLPDPLLTHILSFLPTKEAVHTCILAKRWIKVWASLPVLIFHDPGKPSHIKTEEEYQKHEAKFVRFLGSIIFNRSENITLDTFKLTRSGNKRGTVLHIFEFLCCAVECRPRVLSIDIDGCTFFDLPDSICTCTSVEEMSLRLISDNNLEPRGPRSINLPSLKNLELSCWHFNDDIMRMLISGCPILEELVLINCYLELNLISSNVLKKLVLDDCGNCEPVEISCPGVVSLSIIRSNYNYEPMVISCPGVVSLSIKSTNEGGITLKNMSSLATADFCFGDHNEWLYLDHIPNHDLRLLSGLSNVTSLRLFTRCPTVMDLLQEDIITNCPTLKNLKSLALGSLDFNGDWDLVVCLLQHSSNLKTLTLEFYQSDDFDEEEYQQDLRILFQQYLEAVKIICPGKNVKLAEEDYCVRDEKVFTTALFDIFD